MAKQRLTLIVVCIAIAMLMLDIAVVNTALPDIGHGDPHAYVSGLHHALIAGAGLAAGSARRQARSCRVPLV